MLIDIIISLFLAAVIAAILGVVVYIFVKHPEILVMAIFVAIILIGLVVAPSVAEGYEERTCFVTGFRLDIGCVEVTDEDGYSQLFELGQKDWFIGQEFTLKFLPVPELWNDIEQVA